MVMWRWATLQVRELAIRQRIEMSAILAFAWWNAGDPPANVEVR
jgi:hypothetical protein